MRQKAGWERESFYFNQGKKQIVGLDEVGRGCLAGPLVAVAYCFNHPWPYDLILFDSKQLTETKRKLLAESLPLLGIIGIGVVEASEIDRLGLQPAQYRAYERALSQFSLTIDIVLLDGRAWKSSPYPHEAIVKGDQSVASIAAASVVAKVYRDTYMRTVVHSQFPSYGFDVHVGYGTKLHQNNLARLGPCPEHRQSFKPVANWSGIMEITK